MEVTTRLYFIALIFRRSDLSRFIWHFLLILNIIMFCLVIQFNNNLVSNISAASKKINRINSQRFSNESKDTMPLIIPKIESIKREYYKDILDDGFNFEKFGALGENAGNKLGLVSNYISIKRTLKDIRQPGCLKKSYPIDKLPKALRRKSISIESKQRYLYIYIHYLYLYSTCTLIFIHDSCTYILTGLIHKFDLQICLIKSFYHYNHIIFN